ncbi:MAG: alpha/beta hydrolase [Dehalococcoidia bacterium]
MEQDVLELNERERIAYTVRGDGPLVVLSYIFGAPAWGDVSRLAQRCTVAAPEWLESTTEFETRSSLRWFAPFVRALGFERAALATWSLGAPPAIRFAASGPADLSHLVLVDPAGLRPGLPPGLPPLKLSDVPYFVLAHVLGRPTRGYARARWRAWVRNPAVDTRALEELDYRFLSRPGALRTNSRLERDAVQRPLLDELASVVVPTLLLAGRHSTVLGPDYAERAAARLPQGKLVVFEESAHALQLEEPERFQDEVADFVRGSG